MFSKYSPLPVMMVMVMGVPENKKVLELSAVWHCDPTCGRGYVPQSELLYAPLCDCAKGSRQSRSSL